MKSHERDVLEGIKSLLNAAERDLNWNHVVSASATVSRLLEGEYDILDES